MKGCLYGVVGFFVFLMILAAIGNGSRDSDGTARQTAEERCSQSLAWVYAQEGMEDYLRSPSTANYPSMREAVFQRVGAGCQYRVASYVDAQNAFGGVVRENFEIYVRFEGDRVRASLLPMPIIRNATAPEPSSDGPLRQPAARPAVNFSAWEQDNMFERHSDWAVIRQPGESFCYAKQSFNSEPSRWEMSFGLGEPFSVVGIGRASGPIRYQVDDGEIRSVQPSGSMAFSIPASMTAELMGGLELVVNVARSTGTIDSQSFSLRGITAASEALERCDRTVKGN